MRTEVIITGPFSGWVRKTKNSETYLKFLMTKFLTEEEGISEIELQNMWIIVANLFEVPVKNRNLSDFQLGLIQEEYVSKIIPGSRRNGKLWFYTSAPLINLILNPHEYYGLKLSGWLGKVLQSIQLLYRTVTKLKYPDSKFIGVGYKDKGSQTKNSTEKKARLEADAHYYLNKKLTVKPARFNLSGTELKAKLDLNLQQFTQRVVVL
jgi:hypothetical protein